MCKRTILAALLGAVGVGGVAAQDGGGGIITATDYNIFGYEAEPLETPFAADRPRTRSSVGVVPVGRFSVEAGATYTYDDEDGVEAETLAGPELLVRTGIMPRLEGRVGWTGFQRVDVSATGFDDTTDGITDMSAGVKLSIIDKNTGAVPALVAVAEVSIPVGDDEFSSDRVDPSLEVAFDYDELHEIYGFSGGVRVASLENQANDDDFLQTGVSLSFDQEWDEQVETFVEYFAFFNSDNDIDDSHFVQTGVVFTIAPNVTLDARVGAGLTSESTDLFAGAGGSVSF